MTHMPLLPTPPKGLPKVPLPKMMAYHDGGLQDISLQRKKLIPENIAYPWRTHRETTSFEVREGILRTQWSQNTSLGEAAI